MRNARNAIASLSAAAQQEVGAQQALEALAQASAALDTLESEIGDVGYKLNAAAIGSSELSRKLRQLDSGLETLAAGTRRLDAGAAGAGAQGAATDSGLGALRSGAQELDRGVAQLDAASGSLAAGLGTLGAGAERLRSGLDAGVTDSLGLAAGLDLLRTGVVRYRGRTDRGRADLAASGTDLPRAAESGYLVLAGIEGSPAQARTNSAFAVNAGGGGTSARAFVVPDSGPFGEGSPRLRAAIAGDVERLGREMNAQAVLGGPAAVLDDFDRVTEARFPWLVIALVIATIAVLLVVFRSPVLAVSAVLLNLVTAGAAVGVLTLAFQGSAPLGGPGYLDAISLSGIFAIVFGLSIDYEVFLIARIVEGRTITGTTDGAIAYGLRHTAGIITGAAAIMTGVFVAFALSDVANTRQFGVGLTVAVALDATVVRLVLLPALIRLAGERTWWVPRWLDRLLPRLAPR